MLAWRWPAPQAQPQGRISAFVYPAGGQQGTTFQIRLGGQNLDDVNGVLVTGKGVSAKVVEYHRRLDSQDMTLLREQLAELKQAGRAGGTATMMNSAPP